MSLTLQGSGFTGSCNNTDHGVVSFPGYLVR